MPDKSPGADTARITLNLYDACKINGIKETFVHLYRNGSVNKRFIGGTRRIEYMNGIESMLYVNYEITNNETTDITK